MIIRTILDTDLYKFTTSYAYIKLFPYAMGTFSFKDRDETEYSDEFVERLKTEISRLSHVALTGGRTGVHGEELPFPPQSLLGMALFFPFPTGKIEVRLDEDRHLHIEISDYLYKATLYEVPLLAIVSEIKNQSSGNIASMGDILCKLSEKAELSNKHQLFFSEFGTRRRFSFDVQDQVIGHLRQTARYCIGTSNCHFAMKYGMKPMGTHPHEWFMFHGAQFGYKHANYMALENWVNVYDGDLGIALSDTYTSAIFLSNLSRKQAKLFDGVRCDSGDEFRFIDRLTARYKELGIDSTTKTIVFSNALDFDKALDIQKYCRGKIRCSFGIGTNLTNDTGFKPSNIVMKLSQCKMNLNQEWRECVKLSDDIGKHISDPEEVRACLYDLRLE